MRHHGIPRQDPGGKCLGGGFHPGLAGILRQQSHPRQVRLPGPEVNLVTEFVQPG